jgi:potassium-dependent mechanosensitive channel
MSRFGRHCFWVFGLVFILGVALTTSLEAQEKSGQSTPITGSSAMSPEKLPDILAEGAAKLQSSIEALRKQQEPEKQTLKDLIKEKEDLQARIAALNASMAVNELTLARAREAVKNLGNAEEKTGARLKESAREQEASWQKIQDHASSLLSVEELMAELAKTNHPLHSSKELQKAYRAYRQLGQEYDAAAKRYQEILGKSIENLQASMKLINETRTKLEEDYLEKALKHELLKRQTPKHRLQEIGQIVLTLAALPGKACLWLMDMGRSGALFSFIEENWTNLTGLVLLLVLLGVGTVRLEKLALPRLAAWQERVTEVGQRVLLTFVLILMKRIFSLGFVGWLYVAFWTLGIISNKVAWLVWSLTTVLVALRIALHMLHQCLAGVESGGVIPISDDVARFFRWHLSLMAISVFLLRLFILPNSGLLGFSPEGAGSLRSFFQVMLLGWVLWLLSRSHLDPVLTVLPAPAFMKNKGFLRALRIIAFLVFAFVVVSGLLGLKYLFEYVAQGAFFTLALLALAWVLGEGAHTLLRWMFHPERGVVAKKFPGRDQLFLKSYKILNRTVRVALAVVAFLVTLEAWGIPSVRVASVFMWLSRGPSLGPVELTPINIGLTVLVIYMGFWVSRVLRSFLELKFFPAKDWDTGIKYTVSMSSHYLILVFTALIALNTLGLSLANLALVAGGLGVGIGFGLQNIVSNFLSGLIILFERPIKVGDMLIIDGQWGTVKEIRVRSTIFETFERYFLIIPNSELISGKILNWTYGGWGINRLTLKVGVSYDSDPLKVTRVIEGVCRANPRVVADPPPQVFFEAYGDSSLNFNIWVHLATPDDRIPATHELNSSIFEAFQHHGIEIPFPQRDLHVRSWSREALAAMHAFGDGSSNSVKAVSYEREVREAERST